MLAVGLVEETGEGKVRVRTPPDPRTGEMAVELDLEELVHALGRGSRAGSRTGSWARLLRRVVEVDSLLCPSCGVEMKVVSVVTEPRVVDRILRYVTRGGGHNPFGERAPPQGREIAAQN